MAILLLTLASATASAQPSAAEVQKKVDSVAAAELSGGPTAGISVLVAQRGTILVAKGYGLADIEQQTPTTERTVYRLGSLSKQFTAAALLKLVEQGKVSLDESIRTYLPNYPEAGNAVTVRHLLQHTSGLTNYTAQSDYWRHMNDDLPRTEVLEWFASKPPVYTPGTRYVYCNTGYFLLGLIIEKVSGESYEAFVQTNLLDPIGLKATYYDGGKRAIPEAARGYMRDAGKLVPCRPLNLELVAGAGAMASTALDVYAFHQGLRAGKVLSPEIYKLMITPPKLAGDEPSHYGMGFHVDQVGKHTVQRHGGLVFGFKSCYYYYPEEDLTIIILMNTEEAEYRPIQDAIVRLFLPDIPQDVVWE